MATTYSFKDMAGAFVHPTGGTMILAGGNLGLGSISVENAQERTVHDVAADGSVMVTYVAGDTGSVSIEMQQTSDLHKFLLRWFNIIKTAADLGQVQMWAAGVLTVRNILDGSTHTAFGVSPSKVPGKTYTTNGQRVTWVLMSTQIISE